MVRPAANGGPRRGTTVSGEWCLCELTERLTAMFVVMAYFDPGAGSMLLQAVVGGTAGLVVLARYLWELAWLSRRIGAPTDERGTGR